MYAINFDPQLILTATGGPEGRLTGKLAKSAGLADLNPVRRTPCMLGEALTRGRAAGTTYCPHVDKVAAGRHYNSMSRCQANRASRP